MQKDFDAWNKIKKEIEIKEEKLSFKEGDVWWSTIGINIRTESSGKGDMFRRPVLILKKLTSDSFVGIPLSSKDKQGSWYESFFLGKEKSLALLNEIKKIDAARLQRKIGRIKKEDFLKVKAKLKALLDL